MRSADNQWAGKHSGEAAIDYLEFVQRLLPPDFPKRDQMFVDDIASMAHEDTKKSAIKSEISSVHEFVQTFQDKVTTLPTCACLPFPREHQPSLTTGSAARLRKRAAVRGGYAGCTVFSTRKRKATSLSPT